MKQTLTGEGQAIAAAINASLGSKIDVVDSKLTMLSNKVSEVDTKVEVVSTRVDQQDERISKLESAMTAMRNGTGGNAEANTSTNTTGGSKAS